MKERLSYYSWTALLGLAVAAGCAFVALVLARSLVGSQDDRTVDAFVWGGVVGIALGGIAVGRLLAQSVAGALTRCVLTPGVCVGLPLLAGAAVTQEVTSVLPEVLGLAAVSCLAAEATRWITIRDREERNAA